jgi:tetratricopeptide (TPR) repeat protein
MRKLLRAVLVGMRLLGVLALLVPALPAFGDDTTDRAALDILFAQLRMAPDAETASAIDEQIWARWTRPSNPVLAKRMGEIVIARSMGRFPTAIALLDKLVAEYPDYAEGWNQRATLYYLMGDFEHSIADCGKVLALEPRHFGALSGRALMYLQQGKRALALRDMAAALAIHPFLSEAALFPELSRPMTHV